MILKVTEWHKPLQQLICWCMTQLHNYISITKNQNISNMMLLLNLKIKPNLHYAILYCCYVYHHRKQLMHLYRSMQYSEHRQLAYWILNNMTGFHALFGRLQAKYIFNKLSQNIIKYSVPFLSLLHPVLLSFALIAPFLFDHAIFLPLTAFEVETWYYPTLHIMIYNGGNPPKQERCILPTTPKTLVPDMFMQNY